jgi:hypothetical protein
VPDDAVLVHDEGGAIGKSVLRVQDAVLFGNRPLKIAQKREGNPDLLGESAVGG